MLAFGPVPSRRLGSSLGINNIPPKYCTYACIYCQLGKTLNLEIGRRNFYEPAQLVNEVVKKVKKAPELDYVTFVSDGEPTLDINLGKEIDLLKEKINFKIAVLTNGSLLFKEDVREDLFKVDLVSLKIDALSEELWRKIDRPHRGLNLSKILEGMVEFSSSFKGKLITETMLINNFNDNEKEIGEIAKFLQKIKPAKAYLAIPTRPPAEKITGAGEETLVAAYDILQSQGLKVEYLIGYEGDEFASTGRVEDDILSITAVHPLREDYIYKLIEKKGLNPSKVLHKLLNEGKLISIKYKNYKFYMRRMPSRLK